MGCDYYVQTELVIEYLDKMGRLSIIYTDRFVDKRYIYQPSDYDSDDDWETAAKKYHAEIEHKIAENTYEKHIFSNDTWVKPSYKTKYDERFMREFKEIHNIKKIYKKTTAWKRN
jgi:hypothetical protein